MPSEIFLVIRIQKNYYKFKANYLIEFNEFCYFGQICWLFIFYVSHLKIVNQRFTVIKKNLFQYFLTQTNKRQLVLN